MRTTPISKAKSLEHTPLWDTFRLRITSGPQFPRVCCMRLAANTISSFMGTKILRIFTSAGLTCPKHSTESARLQRQSSVSNPHEPLLLAQQTLPFISEDQARQHSSKRLWLTSIPGKTHWQKGPLAAGWYCVQSRRAEILADSFANVLPVLISSSIAVAVRMSYAFDCRTMKTTMGPLKLKIHVTTIVSYSQMELASIMEVSQQSSELASHMARTKGLSTRFP